MYIYKARKFVHIKFTRRYTVHPERLNDFPSCYNASDTEQGWYEVWEKNKFFQPQNTNEIYRMILPPPNVTGTLHLGHALTVTVQDILARWYRMKGFPVIWVPGFDHAGIATQAVVEKYLSKTKNIKRNSLTRTEFHTIVNDWKNNKSKKIKNQLKELGASVDWSREYFTMDEHHSKAVKEAFVILNKRQLLYRDKSLVNWSSALGSTLSDIELEFETVTGKVDLSVSGYNNKVTFGQIYEISYDLINSDDKLSVATTRPETLPGDVALAVHPDDERYSQFIGQLVWHPLKKTSLPVIADENVKRDFGTGIVKITPAHDKLDFNIAKKHGLKMIEVINEDGKLTKEAGRFQGLPRFIARENILTELVNLNALKSVKDHPMLIPRCSRTGDIIEQLLREQWFISCKNMASRAFEAVKNGSLKLNPSMYNDIWLDWLNDTNYRDWCVSRQLWWGHQIPAYYYKQNYIKHWVVASSEDEALKHFRTQYGNSVWVQQDSDVLDTWFSSALLPISSFGWPNQTVDLKKYYPLSIMETGHDILIFWVARMVMLGLELTDKLPFNEVLLHGILCDAQEKKMSKSRGNVIFPENVINGVSLQSLNEQVENNFFTGILNIDELKETVAMNTKNYPNGIANCGVDALRFTLCSHNIKERTVTFDITECEQNKFFLNKIWQASKYLLQMTNDYPIVFPQTLTTIDKWILSRLSFMVDSVNNGFDEKAFYKAVSSIKQFMYYEFCDYYLVSF
ncbi:PREDICTED: valine--tRNA ligase, mitochondrial-like [Ceratosolen solmsi marchali]|uniref:valine--tRNA ligase n=1 Tax=Ceratosolen solmsi marchali TaxID=326594 RepID=A0AAJ6YKJ1_9HYME|nr:PREDICTED: valine--tRNA ligase, mitochondrial-like [Ceratosolen solmsi marchali]